MARGLPVQSLAQTHVFPSRNMPSQARQRSSSNSSPIPYPITPNALIGRTLPNSGHLEGLSLVRQSGSRNTSPLALPRIGPRPSPAILRPCRRPHRAIGAEDPCKAEIVKATFRGIRRVVGTAQREAKPLLREDLFQMLERMGDRPKDLRDKALLLIGFAGAFRRSELVGLD